MLFKISSHAKIAQCHNLLDGKTLGCQWRVVDDEREDKRYVHFAKQLEQRESFKVFTLKSSMHPTLLIVENIYRIRFISDDISLSLRMFVSKKCAYICVCVCLCVYVSVFTVLVNVCAHHPYWDVAALPAMSGTASLRVAAGENDDDEIKILRPAEGAAAISLAAVRIDLFQHLTFNHDKTVGKLIVLQDIRHQSPLILSGAPRCMNTNRLSRQPSHPLLPFLCLLSLFPSLSPFFSDSPLALYKYSVLSCFFAHHSLIAYSCPNLFFPSLLVLSPCFSAPLKKLTTKPVLLYL